MTAPAGARALFPGGKRFAFTIIDDTDVGTVRNLTPVYRLLESLGMRTTKTVWPCACPEGSRDFGSSQTLEDRDYREFVVDLQRRGFEIASHGATMSSSTRPRTEQGLERFREILGAYPRVHANHAYNRENLYWGPDRFDVPLLRQIFPRLAGQPPGHYQGAARGSPYWWGDLCAAHIHYVRNLTFQGLDLLKVNPSMPYHDPRRPLVRWWFSAADAEDGEEFNRLLAPARIDALECSGGACIVATHLAKGFSSGARVPRETERRLELLASRDGWFPTVSELLDWLRTQRQGDRIEEAEWRRMQWLWARELFASRLARRARRAGLTRRSARPGFPPRHAPRSGLS